MTTQLSADARLVISQWRGRPGATLHVIHDVCVPAGRISGHTMIPAVEEVRAAGLTDVVYDGHILTEAGRELLASLTDEDGPGIGANPEGLADLDPMDDAKYAAAVQAYSDRLRDLTGHPRIDLLRAPSGVPGGLLEAPGESRE